MLHPDTELRFIDDSVGYGVVATRRIPRGTITWARCELDHVFDPADAERLPSISRELLEKYSFADKNGQLILCWDHGRFVNHSCRPNCLSPGYDFEIAVRDIEVGDQLTDDYAMLNLDWGFDCLCAQSTCRKRIRPSDMLELADQWDAEIAAAFPFVALVDQPLWALVEAPDDVLDRAHGRGPVPSCRDNYHDPAASTR